MSIWQWFRERFWLWCFAFAGVMLFILGLYTGWTTPPPNCPPCPPCEEVRR